MLLETDLTGPATILAGHPYIIALERDIGTKGAD